MVAAVRLDMAFPKDQPANPANVLPKVAVESADKGFALDRMGVDCGLRWRDSGAESLPLVAWSNGDGPEQKALQVCRMNV